MSIMADDQLPLSALLSQALVAFIIEFDNEFEHRIPHRTSNHGSTRASHPVTWLVSMAMWVKFLRFVPGAGISVDDWIRSARLSVKESRMWLARLSKWWGYVAIEPTSVEGSVARSKSKFIIRPTVGGQKALDAWHPLTAVIEKRWQKRFGTETFDSLRESLQILASKLDHDLPDSLPILGYDLLSHAPQSANAAPAANAMIASVDSDLPALLSKALLAFAIDFERQSRISLALGANLLRLVGREGVRVRDLPRLSGVAKEASNMLLRRLVAYGLASLKSESPGSRVRLLTLTAKGQRAQGVYRDLTSAIEQRWQSDHGADAVLSLRKSLELLAGEAAGSANEHQSRLFAGLEPYRDNWRASLPKLAVLPHFPMILHRGGFPDGS